MPKIYKNKLPDHLKFYCGYDRYGHFGKYGHIVVCCLNDRDVLRDAVCDLDGQDDDAHNGANVIIDMVEEGIAYMGRDQNPVEAMKKAIENFHKKGNDNDD